jgi:hypothetical protein
MSDTEHVLVGMDLHVGTKGTIDPHHAEVKPQKTKDAE